MTRENIEQIIKDLFRSNYHSYSDQYQGNDARQIASEIAILYYHTRTDNEVERDMRANVICNDYIRWVCDELTRLQSNR